MQQETREVLYKYMRMLGCPDAIAIRMIKPVPGEVYKPSNVRRADESMEDFLQRTLPARYEQLRQRLANESEYRYQLRLAELIGERVGRDIANDFK